MTSGVEQGKREQIQDLLTRAAAMQAELTFIDPASATVEQALGIAVAQTFGWNGDAILRLAQAALEDANFHDEAERVGALVAR